MKDRSLCPTVQGTSYGGVEPGAVITDHDLALAYVLDHHPEMLPSFRVLTTEQRRVVRFIQRAPSARNQKGEAVPRE